MHLALRILTTARALEKAAGRVFKPHGLTSAQFNVLNLLAQNPGGMRASDLASALIVDPSNVTGLLKRMKREGLLVQVDSPSDRRQYIADLSPKGRVKWQGAHRDYEKCLEMLVEPFSAAKLSAADSVLQHAEATASKLP